MCGCSTVGHNVGVVSCYYLVVVVAIADHCNDMDWHTVVVACRWWDWW